eukprot:4640127-Lingulodinium_polyedra.AAC.1
MAKASQPVPEHMDPSLMHFAEVSGCTGFCGVLGVEGPAELFFTLVAPGVGGSLLAGRFPTRGFAGLT